MYIYEHFVPYYTVPFHAHRAQYWEEINYFIFTKYLSYFKSVTQSIQVIYTRNVLFYFQLADVVNRCIIRRTQALLTKYLPVKGMV